MCSLAPSVVVIVSVFCVQVSAQFSLGNSSIQQRIQMLQSSFSTFQNSKPTINLNNEHPFLNAEQFFSSKKKNSSFSNLEEVNMKFQTTYLYKQGVAMVFSGPYRFSNVYDTKYYVSVEQDIDDPNDAQYKGSVRTQQGRRIVIFIPAKVEFIDKISYYVEIRGRSSGKDWTQFTSGSFTVRVFEPHSDPTETREAIEDVASYNQHAGFTRNGENLEVELIGLKDFSSAVSLSWDVNVNKEIDQEDSVFSGFKKAAMFSGATTVDAGKGWSFTVRGLRVVTYDTVFFSVKARQLTTGETREYSGFYQFPKEIDLEERLGGPENEDSETTSSQTVGAKIVKVPSSFTNPEVSIVTSTSTSTTTTTSTTETPCKPSSSTYNNGKRPCVDTVLDHNNFLFKNENQIGGFNQEDTFTVFSEDNVVNENLTFPSIKPSLLEDKYGENFVDQNLTLSRCTAINPTYCNQKASGYIILPPVLSGRRTTKDSFSFRYGKLEVTAKLPSGDWIVPELWLLPKYRVYGNDSGKIVLAMSRGNKQLFDGVSDFSNHVLEAGVQVNSVNLPLFRLEQDLPWSHRFHTFQLLWTPDELVFSVDGKEVGRVTPGPEGLDPKLRGTKLAPFDQEFYLVYGVHVGGEKDFSDPLINKPWINYEPKGKLNFWRAKPKWSPSWSDDSTLRISNIKFTSLSS